MSPRELPMAGGSSESAPSTGAAGPPPPLPRPRASSGRLIATLAVAGGLAGLAIVFVHQWSQPRIEAYQALVLRESVIEVIGGPEHARTFFLLDGAFTDAPTMGADTASADRLYVGYDAAGAPMGVALQARQAGYQDVIRLIFGYDPGTGRVLGMKVLDSRETPGLGDVIEKNAAWIAGFAGAATPLEPVKAGTGRGTDTEVDMITGATISTRAVIDAINARLREVGAQVDALWRSGVAPVAPAEPVGPSVSIEPGGSS